MIEKKGHVFYIDTDTSKPKPLPNPVFYSVMHEITYPLNHNLREIFFLQLYSQYEEVISCIISVYLISFIYVIAY